jgi:hypothetical protein
MTTPWAETARKIWRDIFWDDYGLNLPAVSYTVAWGAAIALAVRATINSGQFDFLQYSFGISALLVGYGAAAGSRARTNARFRRLEARIHELECQSQSSTSGEE